jgi:ABC-type siderophore export system fused ATPase/permease subunit
MLYREILRELLSRGKLAPAVMHDDRRFRVADQAATPLGRRLMATAPGVAA